MLKKMEANQIGNEESLRPSESDVARPDSAFTCQCCQSIWVCLVFRDQTHTRIGVGVPFDLPSKQVSRLAKLQGWCLNVVSLPHGICQNHDNNKFRTQDTGHPSHPQPRRPKAPSLCAKENPAPGRLGLANEIQPQSKNHKRVPMSNLKTGLQETRRKNLTIMRNKPEKGEEKTTTVGAIQAQNATDPRLSRLCSGGGRAGGRLGFVSAARAEMGSGAQLFSDPGKNINIFVGSHQ